MISQVEISENQASALGAQLWRYYDVDACGAVYTTLDKYSKQIEGRDVYRVWYDGERGINYQFISIRLVGDTVEDLYLVGTDELIEPTTTREEQELR